MAMSPLSYITTVLVSFVGSSSFAYADGQRVPIAIALGLGVACCSLTAHRIVVAIHKVA